jgi:predicted KAP-like P-loop ATPase
MSARVLPDWPETTHFDFGEWCEHFSEMLVSAETLTPISIAITGSWGEGKTSLLRGIYSHLRDNYDGKAKLVWFDAWQYHQKLDLLTALRTFMPGGIHEIKECY